MVTSLATGSKDYILWVKDATCAFISHDSDEFAPADDSSPNTGVSSDATANAPISTNDDKSANKKGDSTPPTASDAPNEKDTAPKEGSPPTKEGAPPTKEDATPNKESAPTNEGATASASTQPTTNPANDAGANESDKPPAEDSTL